MKSHGIWQKVKLTGILLLMLVSTFELGPLECWAESRGGEDGGDGYNFSWLDPDKKIYVLQNRRYRKANRALVSVMGGMGLTNAFRTVYNFDPRLAYYFSESFGVETFMTLSSNRPNNTFKALEDTIRNAVLPVVREIRSQYGVLAHWAPWYSKINVFNSVLYFDWYFEAGFGQMNTQLDTNKTVGKAPILETQNFTTYYIGTGHQYHLSETWIVRLDALGAYYQAPLYGNSGDSTWFGNWNFNIGIGARL